MLTMPEELLGELTDRIEQLTHQYNLEKHEVLTPAQAAETDLLGFSNIVGFGIGEKSVAGLPTGAPAIQVLVVRKAPSDQVEPDYIASSMIANAKLELYQFVEIDVIEVGRPILMHHSTKTLLPHIPSGASVGSNVGGTSGTVATWLTDGIHTYLLTCWHCVGASSAVHGKTQLFHPANGKPVARLTTTLSPNTGSRTTMDVAIGEALDPSTAGDFVMGIGEIRGTMRTRITYFPVRKYGAITHLTNGGITSLTASLTLTAPDGQAFLYRNQLGILPDPSRGPFAASGDSGSLVMSQDNRAMGMLVGGDQQIPYYIATPINAVMDELKNAGFALKFVTYP